MPFFVNFPLFKEAYLVLSCNYNEQYFARLVDSFASKCCQVILRFDDLVTKTSGGLIQVAFGANDRVENSRLSIVKPCQLIKFHSKEDFRALHSKEGFKLIVDKLRR
ncbi:MAG TPA: hypothetical protein DEV81_06635 [Cyanobacteria bacterium UBA11049]|nr:hypothetical protein [Cyanobacteria bacterium UBA11049]